MRNVPSPLPNYKRHVVILRPIELSARQIVERHDDVAPHGEHVTDIVLAPQKVNVPVGLEEREQEMAIPEMILVAIDEVGTGPLVHCHGVSIQRIRLYRVVMVNKNKEIT